ncbi:type VI secretion system-associated protein TagO [Reyranella massiliensis]|uniref:type VI secretion system-associated protein TagO n=1 Tax=Reyranella massiliensis TaxID=445220 RepID=UPI0005C28ABD|nr:type VI secretion system-associated protein TagO [Reyranella massiliensis]
MRVLVAALLLAVGLSSNAAAQWSPFNVSDHLRGNTGVGVTASGEIDGQYGKRKAELNVFCAENETRIIIASKPFYVGGDNVTMEYTLNGGPVQKATWGVCKGDGCIGLWRGAGIPFLKSLYDKALLRMVIHPRHLAPSRLTFPIAGAKEAFEPLAKLCKWG